MTCPGLDRVGKVVQPLLLAVGRLPVGQDGIGGHEAVWVNAQGRRFDEECEDENKTAVVIELATSTGKVLEGQQQGRYRRQWALTLRRGTQLSKLHKLETSLCSCDRKAFLQMRTAQNCNS